MGDGVGEGVGALVTGRAILYMQSGMYNYGIYSYGLCSCGHLVIGRAIL